MKIFLILKFGGKIQQVKNSLPGFEGRVDTLANSTLRFPPHQAQSTSPVPARPRCGRCPRRPQRSSPPRERASTCVPHHTTANHLRTHVRRTEPHWTPPNMAVPSISPIRIKRGRSTPSTPSSPRGKTRMRLHPDDCMSSPLRPGGVLSSPLRSSLSTELSSCVHKHTHTQTPDLTLQRSEQTRALFVTPRHCSCLWDQ